MWIDREGLDSALTNDLLPIVELAWAAGFFEGEGCATKSATTLQVLIGQTGSDYTLRRFHNAVNGIGTIRGPYRNGQYVWRSGGKEAHTVMEMLYPYLSSECVKWKKYQLLLLNNEVIDRR